MVSQALLVEDPQPVVLLLVSLVRLIPYSLETLDSRPKSGASSSSSVHAEKLLKLELPWVMMAEPRVSLTFSSPPLMVPRKLWSLMDKNSMDALSD